MVGEFTVISAVILSIYTDLVAKLLKSSGSASSRTVLFFYCVVRKGRVSPALSEQSDKKERGKAIGSKGLREYNVP